MHPSCLRLLAVGDSGVLLALFDRVLELLCSIVMTQATARALRPGPA